MYYCRYSKYKYISCSCVFIVPFLFHTIYIIFLFFF